MTNRFGIYLHIPFCVHKCSYCDFYSFTKYSLADFQSFTDRLCLELEESARWLRNTKNFSSVVSSIFMGGGTPSLLPVPMTHQILEALFRNFEVESGAEITMEANPETVTRRFCEELKSTTAINRISLGAQSFSEENLKKLERLGSKESIYNAVSLLKEAGFANFNLDLIFAIPGQNEGAMLNDIAEVAALGASHVSSYNLTLKPGHKLYTKLPEDDFVAGLYEIAVVTLAKLGYEQYEISNYAKENYTCQHNLLYWSGGDFLGVGPSAASRFFWNGVFHHRKQLSDFGKYMEACKFDSTGFETTTPEQTVLEATFLELRRNTGIDVESFAERYRFNPTRAKSYPLFLKEGFITHEGKQLKLTPKGRLLADLVTERLAHT